MDAPGIMEFLDYMEDIGYDPIGASDTLSDAAHWYRSNPEVWDMTPEGAYKRFIQSPIYATYYGGSNG